MRRFELWPHRHNQFVCDGRYITGPDHGPFYSAICLISIPGLLFLATTGRELWTLASPLITLLSFYTLAFSLASLAAAAYTDPGIIPRDNKAEDITLIKDMEREIVVAGQLIKQRWCKTCHIWRPPRSSHCSTCDNCILEFDHHCPWVGNCVGKRNYRYFLAFVGSCTWNAAFFFGCCILYGFLKVKELKQHGTTDVIGILKSGVTPIVTCVLLLYSFIIAWTLVGLLGYNVYLISRGQTTYENMRGRPAGSASPFYGSFWSYVCRTCCLSKYPSALRLREIVTDIDELEI